MQIRSQQDLDNLDMSLNMFDEGDWDFMGIDPNETKNFEYFNDIRDTDYLKPSSKLKYVAPIIATSCTCLTVMAVASVFALNYVGYFSDEVYDPQLATTEDSLVVVRVDGGVAAESEDGIEATKTLSSYFAVLQEKSDYSALYGYCSGTSSFASTYNSFVSQMEVNYDTYDCYARAMKYFGGQVKLSSINEIIEKDGVYYVYADAYLPTTADIISYMRYNDYNISKHFTSNDVTETNMLMYFTELTSTSQVTYTLQEYCFEFKYDSDGNMVLINDSDIADACISAYNTVISEMESTISNSL